MGIRIFGVALAAIALGTVTVAPASAAPEDNKIIEIRSVDNGLCLALGGKVTQRAGMSACDGSAAQQFERVPAAAGGGSYLRNLGTGTCLDGYDSTVTSWPCNSAEAGQRFQEVPAADGTVKLSVAGRSGTRFADSFLFSRWNEVNMFDASDSSTQLWQVRETGAVPTPQLGAVVKLKSANAGTCVADSVEYINELKACADAPGFERIDVGEGKVALRSQATGKCLTVSPPPSSNAVLLEPCVTTEAAQQWTLTGDELGNYKVANADQHLMPSSNHVIVYDYAGIGLLQIWQLPAA
ncbi:RICIN domain-containing protein [Lentzea sp. NPDC055074]